jgi:hypothetical protein
MLGEHIGKNQKTIPQKMQEDTPNPSKFPKEKKN